MILIDLDVLLDVVQPREPHYRASAAVLEEVTHGRVDAIACPCIDDTSLPRGAIRLSTSPTPAAAEAAGCTAIVTWNVKDFASSPVEALTSELYLLAGREGSGE